MEMQITLLIEIISMAYPIGVAYQIMIRSTNYSIIKKEWKWAYGRRHEKRQSCC